MGEHERPEAPEAETVPAADELGDQTGLPPADVIESKVVASTVATLGASLVVAFLTANLEPFGLPAWALYALAILGPPIAAAAAGYVKRSNRA